MWGPPMEMTQRSMVASADVFGEGGGLIDGFDGGADFGDDTFAGAPGVDDAVAAIAEGSVVQLGDEDAGFASCRRRGRR